MHLPFLVAGLLPVLSVLVFSIIIVHVLRQQKNIEHQVLNQHKRLQRRGKYSHREKLAMRIIIPLSVTFFILETPTDICGYFGEELKTPLVELIVNILVEVDSLCNFIIYTSTTRSFKRVWKKSFRKLHRKVGADTLNILIVLNVQ